jgi:dihydroflavonol-4-reductase
MKVLITGATGFLGSHLCRRMVTQGHQIRILCRPTSSLDKLGGLPLEKAIGDVTDAESVYRATQSCDWVIHAAAHRRDAVPGEELIQINAKGTRHVAQAAREAGVQRLVHVSSVAAVGISADPAYPADEEFQFNLEQSGLAYQISKRRAEEELFAEVSRGLDAVIVNPSWVFGRHGMEYRGGEMIAKVRRSSVVPYLIGGFCPAHVEDVVGGIVAAFERGKTGQRYILGGENVSFRAALERSARAMGLRRRFVPAPRWAVGLAAVVLEPWDRLRGRRPRMTRAAWRYVSCFQYFDSSKARRALGYAPRDFDAIVADWLAFDRTGRASG